MNPQSIDQNNSEPQHSDVAEKAAARRERLFDPTGKVESLTGDEVLIADIRRHPFGLFLIYVQTFLALGLSLALILFFLPSVVDISSGFMASIASVFALFIVVLGALFLVLATRIYRGNQLIVSDKNITQVLQIGLFDRKVSELSLGNVEDVTAQQRGILPTLFNYGVVIIETAGEQNNFTFRYCPNPNAYAKAISDARINHIEKRGGH